MKIGLVLSGGIAKGAYQIGILQAFQEKFGSGYFDCISTSSIGALVGYTYATDKLDVADKWIHSLSFTNASSFMKYYVRSDNLKNDILKYFTFENPLQKDFFISSLCMSPIRLEYKNLKGLDEETLRLRIISSVMLPAFCSPVVIDGVKCYDGACVDNIPTRPLVDKDVDFIIVSYFDKENYAFESEEFNSKVIRLSLFETKFFNDSFCFEHAALDSMIQKGYEKALAVIEELKLESGDVELIRANNIARNNSTPCTSKRISGDVIVRGLNSVSKRLIRRHTEV